MQNINELIRQHEGLVRVVAFRSFSGHTRDEDLFQCGMIGLWNAAREWDGKRNFSPFACACIRNAMRNYLRDKTKMPILEDIEEWDAGEEQEEITAQSSILSLFVGDSIETRVALLLSQGWQKKEIAEKMGIHPQTVSRICGKIRERIEEQING